MVYRFTIQIPEVSDDLIDQIAGKCPDSLSGASAGKAYVDFSRESNSLGAAIDSAIDDLTSLGVTPLGIQVNELVGAV